MINFFESYLSICERIKSLPRGCLYEKKRPGYSPVNSVPRLPGMLLIFVYIRSFVPVCRDEYVTWYCFELVQFDFNHSSAIITLNPAFILGLSDSKSNSIKAICDL